MTTLLEVRDLSVAYGKVEAVHRVSLKVDEGSIVTVIGPNGAGKTTLLAAIMGTLPARGDIRYGGARIDALTVEQRVAAGLVLVPERRELFGSMKVRDNPELGAFARIRRGDRDVAQALAGEEGLTLSDCHWAVIEFLREYYATYDRPPSLRLVLNAVGAKLTLNAPCTRKTLEALFPDGGCKQACRIAGLPDYYCHTC